VNQFINDPHSIQWLKEVHLKDLENIPPFRSFVLYGNEDAPTRVELFTLEDPFINDVRTVVKFPQKPGQIIKVSTVIPSRRHTENGYDPLWVEAINVVLQEREARVRIKDISDELWSRFIGPMVDAIEAGEFSELEHP
jgi:hypothetical protein